MLCACASARRSAADSRQRERLARQLRRALRLAGVVHRQAEVGHGCARAARSIGCRRRRARPRSAPRPAPTRRAAGARRRACARSRASVAWLAVGGRGVVARERAGVVAEQRAQVADPLVHRRGVGMAQGQGRLEMLERVGMRVHATPRARRRGDAARPHPRRPRRAAGAGRRARRRLRPPPRQGGRDATVQQAAARQPRLLVGERAELGVREVVLGSASSASRTTPRATSSSSASTVSSSLRPLARRTVSKSNERPIAAAAPSTWRATSPSPASRASRSPRSSRRARRRPVLRPASAARYSATNSGSPSLSRCTRRSSSGAAPPGTADRTSSATSSSPSRAGLHDRAVRRASGRRPGAGADGPAAPPRCASSRPAAAAGPAAGGRGRRSRRAWPRRRHGRRRGRRRPAASPAQAAPRTAATPSSSRTWAARTLERRAARQAGSAPARQLGQQQRRVGEVLRRTRRRRGRPRRARLAQQLDDRPVGNARLVVVAARDEHHGSGGARPLGELARPGGSCRSRPRPRSPRAAPSGCGGGVGVEQRGEPRRRVRRAAARRGACARARLRGSAAA